MKNSLLVTAALAGICGSFAGTPAQAAKKAAVACLGVNSCAGKGSCKTDANACKGQNSCKGKGVTMKKSAAMCTKAGGTVAMAEKKDIAPAAAAPAAEAAPAAAPASAPAEAPAAK